MRTSSQAVVIRAYCRMRAERVPAEVGSAWESHLRLGWRLSIGQHG
jgi:hypothetical protein